jgi:hypothetical protein
MEEGRLVTLRAADILVNSLTRQIHDACGERFHQDLRSDGAPAPSAFGQAPDIASVSMAHSTLGNPARCAARVQLPDTPTNSGHAVL